LRANRLIRFSRWRHRGCLGYKSVRDMKDRRDCAGCDVDPAAVGCSSTGAAESGTFRAAGGGVGGNGGATTNPPPVCVTVTSEPPSTHESCLPHFRDDCNRNLLFGCLSAAAGALGNAFVLVQVSRFQQIISVFTLQAPTEVAKVNLTLPPLSFTEKLLTVVIYRYMDNLRKILAQRAGRAKCKVCYVSKGA